MIAREAEIELIKTRLLKRALKRDALSILKTRRFKKDYNKRLIKRQKHLK